MRKIIIISILTSLFAGELEVEGDLKVSGNIDTQGNTITNVGTPVNTTDAANAGYVLSATGGKGRIIILKCPWLTSDGITNCEPPECPEGWNSLTTYNEILSTGVGGGGNSNSAGTNFSYRFAGNTVRYCMEQEDSE